jgi:hypothetical protein
VGNPYAPPGSPDRPGGASPGDSGAGGPDDAGDGHPPGSGSGPEQGPDGGRPEGSHRPDGDGRDRGRRAPGFGRPSGPGRLTPAQARRLSVLVGRFALLVLASLLTSRLPLPWSAAAPVFCALGLVAGVAALRATVGTRTGGAMPVALGVSLGMTAVILLQQVVMLALWPVTADLQRCRERAVTVTAERLCQEDYERRIRELSRLPTG